MLQVPSESSRSGESSFKSVGSMLWSTCSVLSILSWEGKTRWRTSISQPCQDCFNIQIKVLYRQRIICQHPAPKERKSPAIFYLKVVLYLININWLRFCFLNFFCSVLRSRDFIHGCWKNRDEFLFSLCLWSLQTHICSLLFFSVKRHCDIWKGNSLDV